MPPRKVKIVSMGPADEEPPKSTLVVLNDEEDIEPPPTIKTPPQSESEPDEKPLLDSEEIDAILKEVRFEPKATKTDDKEECIQCGKLLSKKSLKYSHTKTCKGLQPEDIQRIDTPDPEEAPPPPPEPEPVKIKKPRAKRAPAPVPEPEEPIVQKAKTAADMLRDQREERRSMRQARISMLASQAL